jgi:hypothetical protein
LPDYLHSCLKYCVEGFTYIVHLTDSNSIPKLTLSGVNQSTVLSTTLFSLLLSDIPRPRHTNPLLYVTVLLSQSWQPDNIFGVLNLQRPSSNTSLNGNSN